MTRILRNTLILLAVAVASLSRPQPICAQALTGAIVGTVRDEPGRAVVGATVQVSSPALIGGSRTVTTDDNGRLHVPVLPPGTYELLVQRTGFASSRESNIRVRAGDTIERRVVLTASGLVESIVVDGAGLDARGSGVRTTTSAEMMAAMPLRRQGPYDPLKLLPGVSPTTPSGGTTLVSVFGSGVNENLFLRDGANLTSTSNGVARVELGMDFVQELQVQSMGASAEFGNFQGGVVNVITKSGGDRLMFGASYYQQPSTFTSQPRRLAYGNPADNLSSGYERVRNLSGTTSLSGPLVRDRAWFFVGYERARDDDSQPGADPTHPHTYAQDTSFVKLTWRIAPTWQLMQSVHYETFRNPELATSVKLFEATQDLRADIPAITFGHLIHASGRALWEARASRFVYSQKTVTNGDPNAFSRLDLPRQLVTGAPAQLGQVQQIRTTGEVTFSYFSPGVLGVDHDWKAGVQLERGQHRSLTFIPNGARFVFTTNANGITSPSQRISQAPANNGGQFVTASAFLSDAMRLGDRVSISAGLRFDHARAISQDIAELDVAGRDTGAIVKGAGTLFTWNTVSPRLGLTMNLDADGRTILRSSYGQYSQGVLTGELSSFRPDIPPTTTANFNQATKDYTTLIPQVPLSLDPAIRRPRTDEFSIGVDRELGRRFAVSAAFVRKDGRDFIGWSDVGGHYADKELTLPDNRTLTVQELQNLTTDRLYELTNPPKYSLTYNGLVVAAEKRWSHGWQAAGSYTYSRTYGLQSSSGISPSGAQVSTVGAPPVNFSRPLTFGQEPNDLVNAYGRLPNDRPHMFRLAASWIVPRTGFVVATSLQAVSGKPWAEAAQVELKQGRNIRVLLEAPGTRRLSSQTILDVRLSRTAHVKRAGTFEFIVDVLNALNDAAEESIASEVLYLVTATSQTTQITGQPNVFTDPRRVMFSVRYNIGR